jgi:2-polyprenyl-3-methyl-5-hydroxy-6-metoxy-1,4-benzoquinol methylase
LSAGDRAHCRPAQQERTAVRHYQGKERMLAKEIDYDPLKGRLGRFVARSAWRRRLFFTALGALFLREWHVKKALRQLSHQRNSWKILDAGMGFGQYTHFMARHFPNATILGIDVKREQIEDARWFTARVGDVRCTFEYADLTEFRQPDTFDLALSVDVMEHVLEDEKVFANIFASLKNEGYFLVGTPTASESKAAEFHSVVGEHVREGYSESEFRQKLEKAGFRILSMKRTYGPWGGIAWRLLQRIPMRIQNMSKLFLPLLVPYYIIAYLPAAFCMMMDVRCENQRGGGWLVLAQK